VTDGGFLLGTHTFATAGDAHRRELAASQSLAVLHRVDVVNVAVPGATNDAGVLPLLRGLTRDAPAVTGRSGPGKPIVSDVLDLLAAEARRRGAARFGFVNGDIQVTQRAIDTIHARGEEAIAVSRVDYGGSLAGPERLLLHGVDMFVFAVDFWRRARHACRPYIVGEPTWDNVYASVALSHGHAVLLNREPLIRHERHTPGRASPFAQYLHVLAAADRFYFTQWCEYVAALEPLRAGGASEEEELALQRRFRRPRVVDRALDAARGALWRARYRSLYPIGTR
jgi:hypothetical protein